MTARAIPAICPRSAAAGGAHGRRAGFALALLLLAVLAPLAACGKKSEPGPPPDEPNTFPRTYPHD